MLGDKSLLEDDLKISYSKAGASHVLAVSGLHVGVVFLVLNFLFGLFIKGNQFAPRCFRSILIIFLLWGYAFLTGASPSVMRASLMFSFLQFGFLFQRPYYAYSSIIASAFILLLYNPHLLFDVGFQLSYTAVLSILFFYPRIAGLGFVYRIKACGYVPSRFRKPVGFVVNWSVDLSVVSLAAQIGTLPLVLYYFHQFSCVFWLSGLFVIPLATCLIYMGATSLLVCYIPYVSTCFVAALSFVASVTNSVVNAIGAMPCAVIDWIDFRFEDAVLCYCAIFSFAGYLVCRKYAHLFLGGLCMCVMLALSVYRASNVSNVSIAVYNYPGRTAVNLFGKDFNNVYATADSVMLNRQLNRFWIRNHSSLPQYVSSHVIEGCGVSVFVVDKDLSALPANGQPVSVDYLVISADVRMPVNKLKGLFRFKHLIVDSSCSFSTSYWWKKQCPSAFLVCERGDFVEHI